MDRSEVLASYLEALDLAPTESSVALLSEIVRRHVAALSFSSVGPRMGDDLPLHTDALLDRIVVRRRGGYCFEQNGLLFEMLDELGFDVTMYLARIVFNREGHPALTHRITVVHLDGVDWLVDVGFGPLGPPMPVPMNGDVAVDSWRRFRVNALDDGARALEVDRDGAFVPLYRFDLVRFGQSDAELGHFYSHRHPEATFVNNLVASRILDDEIRSLRNREYWVVTASGEERHDVADAPDLLRILNEELGIEVDDVEAERLFRELPSIG
jgi:N-hydroxyarylamine O-acetyltransferase